MYASHIKGVIQQALNIKLFASVQQLYFFYLYPFPWLVCFPPFLSLPIEVFTLVVKVERVEAIQGRWKPLTAAPPRLNDKYKKTRKRNIQLSSRNKDTQTM